ncbi:hypothetical protein BLNAU_2888 [Blattamonas nauphoetae]|uniref:Uncharacterized protein n=1 Tax=Blattamonas nauphoetae TaxID=2049346 RepID=A0ABQ9YEX5_9EUKA|nr:hypothetical protein BLNAU_2888 [Blattamonas nauphoetae]
MKYLFNERQNVDQFEATKPGLGKYVSTILRYYYTNDGKKMQYTFQKAPEESRLSATEFRKSNKDGDRIYVGLVMSPDFPKLFVGTPEENQYRQLFVNQSLAWTYTELDSWRSQWVLSPPHQQSEPSQPSSQPKPSFPLPPAPATQPQPRHSQPHRHPKAKAHTSTISAQPPPYSFHFFSYESPPETELELGAPNQTQNVYCLLSIPAMTWNNVDFFIFERSIIFLGDEAPPVLPSLPFPVATSQLVLSSDSSASFKFRIPLPDFIPSVTPIHSELTHTHVIIIWNVNESEISQPNL